MGPRASADERARGLLEELRREPKRLLVDPLVVSVEHLREVLERDPLAHQAVAVRGHALAAEVARIGRADDEERDGLRAGHELLGHLGERAPEWSVGGRLARRV